MANDVIDTRDLANKLADLRCELEDIEDPCASDIDEAKDLQDQIDELEGLEAEIPEFENGEQMIADHYFTEAMKELCEDIGDVSPNLPSYIEIDWEATAENLKVDYSYCEYDGEQYWFRYC